MKIMKDDIQSAFIRRACEGARIAAEINRDYAGKEIYAIGILKGETKMISEVVISHKKLPSKYQSLI